MNAPRPGGTGLRRRDAWVLLVAAAAQGALWAFATPGPLRFGQAALGFDYALQATILAAAVLLAAGWAIARIDGLDRSALGFRRPRQRRAWLVAGVALAIVALGMAWTVDVAAFERDYPWPSVAWLEGSAWRWLLWAALYGLYYVGYEAFYRGAILAWARPRWGDGAANAIQTVLSTLVHLGKPLPELLAAIPAGLAFGFLRMRSGSLGPVIALHLGIGLTLDVLLVVRP